MEIAPQLDATWEKRPFPNSPGQFYLSVPGMEHAASWPMNGDVLDRIIADHEYATTHREALNRVVATHDDFSDCTCDSGISEEPWSPMFHDGDCPVYEGWVNAYDDLIRALRQGAQAESAGR